MPTRSRAAKLSAGTGGAAGRLDDVRLMAVGMPLIEGNMRVGSPLVGG